MTLDDRLRAAGRELRGRMTTERVDHEYEALKAEYEQRTASRKELQRFDGLIAGLSSGPPRSRPSQFPPNVTAREGFASYAAARALPGDAIDGLRVRGGTALLHRAGGRAEAEGDVPGGLSESGKGRRIIGAERQTLAKELVSRYQSGESIRALAASTGRSYAFVHRVLTEHGVQLRQRGGARRRKKA